MISQVLCYIRIGNLGNGYCPGGHGFFLVEVCQPRNPILRGLALNSSDPLSIFPALIETGRNGCLIQNFLPDCVLDQFPASR